MRWLRFLLVLFRESRSGILAIRYLLLSGWKYLLSPIHLLFQVIRRKRIVRHYLDGVKPLISFIKYTLQYLMYVGGVTVGSYFHIWRQCSEVPHLWKKVFSLHNSFSLTKASCSSEITLLSLIPGSLTLHRHFVAAILQTIAAHWKQPEILTTH